MRSMKWKWVSGMPRQSQKALVREAFPVREAPSRPEKMCKEIDMEKIERTGKEMVIDKILAEHPISMPFGKAAPMLGFGTVDSAYTARARGQFPILVTRYGCGLVCMSSDLIDFIVTGKSQNTIKKYDSAKVGKGRPTKVEQTEAKQRGLSIRELRAQQQIAGV